MTQWNLLTSHRPQRPGKPLQQIKVQISYLLESLVVSLAESLKFRRSQFDHELDQEMHMQNLGKVIYLPTRRSEAAKWSPDYKICCKKAIPLIIRDLPQKSGALVGSRVWVQIKPWSINLPNQGSSPTTGRAYEKTSWVRLSFDFWSDLSWMPTWLKFRWHRMQVKPKTWRCLLRMSENWLIRCSKIIWPKFLRMALR